MFSEASPGVQIQTSGREYERRDSRVPLPNDMKLSRENNCIIAAGLGGSPSQIDMLFCFAKSEFGALAEDLCRVLDEYVVKTGLTLNADEKIAWATSVIQMRKKRDILEAHELDIASDEFVPGVTKTLLQWQAQGDVCRATCSRYVMTKLDDRLVASPDVIAGKACSIEGVRYPFNAPNSGWWLFGSDFSGDVMSMKNVHVGHAVLLYPNVVRYFGMEPGFCFKSGDEEKTWFEEEAASRDPV